VVIPAHESASTLAAALASVAAQSYQPSEVVVVDDGSIDESADVAKAWSGMLPLTVLREEAAGAALARHKGVNSTDSQLIALLDADDVWIPDHLETLIRTRADMPQAIVCALGMRWMPGKTIWRAQPAPLPAPADQRKGILLGNFGCGSALFGRELYQRAGGFRSGFEIGEDWDLWIRMIRAGGIIVRPDHPTFCYRLTTGSLTGGGRAYKGSELVLQVALNEATSAEEREWAAEGLGRQSAVQRKARAGMALIDAYDAARSGSPAVARQKARQAISGAPGVAIRSLAVLAWPTAAVSVRDRLSRK
jgi:glycosyltransferase involved in cell wall biosynthesis